MDVREKLEVIAHLDDHITYKEDIGICYDSALAKVIEDAYMTLKNGVTVQELNGCDFCQKFDFAGARAEVNKYGAHISLAICNTKFPDEERFKFCPMCGRRLPQPPKGE